MAEYFNCLMKVRSGDRDLGDRYYLVDKCYRHLVNADIVQAVDGFEIYKLESPTYMRNNLSDCIGVRSLRGGSPEGTCLKAMGAIMEASAAIADDMSGEKCSAWVVTAFDGMTEGALPEFDDDIRAAVIHYRPGVPGVMLEERKVGLSQPAEVKDIKLRPFEGPADKTLGLSPA